MTFRGHGKLAESWWGAPAPATQVSLAAVTYIGVGFQVVAPGRLLGFRAYVGVSGQLPQWAILWDQTNGPVLSLCRFRQDTSGLVAWHQAWVRPWVRLAVGVSYRVAVLKGIQYYRTNGALVLNVTHGSLKFVSSFQTTSIDPHTATLSTTTAANGVDVLYQAD